MTRRTRRRLMVIGGGALIGATLPAWAPRMLSSVPAFRVEHVEVAGTVYVAPDEVVRLANVSLEASVWDNPSVWEARVTAHPLILGARVRREGMRTIQIRVVEDRPVALVATPTLVPTNADGRILPLDPAEAGLDLPILAGRAEVHAGTLTSAPHRELAALLGRLGRYDPGFVRQVSEVSHQPGGAFEVRMLPEAAAERILLPGNRPLTGLRRVELALDDADERRVKVADARFEGQVVLRLEGDA